MIECRMNFSDKCDYVRGVKYHFKVYLATINNECHALGLTKCQVWLIATC